VVLNWRWFCPRGHLAKPGDYLQTSTFLNILWFYGEDGPSIKKQPNSSKDERSCVKIVSTNMDQRLYLTSYICYRKSKNASRKNRLNNTYAFFKLYWCGGSLEGGGEWRRLRSGYVMDKFHILTWNRTEKPLAIALSGAEKG
jgi:hypothetical protein